MLFFSSMWMDLVLHPLFKNNTKSLLEEFVVSQKLDRQTSKSILCQSASYYQLISEDLDYDTFIKNSGSDIVYLLSYLRTFLGHYVNISIPRSYNSYPEQKYVDVDQEIDQRYKVSISHVSDHVSTNIVANQPDILTTKENCKITINYIILRCDSLPP